MPSRRLRVTLACFAALATVVTTFSAGAKTRASASAPLRFSHEVVVDEQRSGFEPDISIGPRGEIYSSVPNGSSTTTSWVWHSVNSGNSFQLVPGNALIGRTLTCAQGGGDTELALDHAGNVFLSDLQNLTNLTNSVSTNQGATWTTSCSGAPNAPVDRMWYAVHGSLGDPDFRIYEEYDAVASAVGVNTSTIPPGLQIGGNELVETVSAGPTGGVVFVPVTNAAPSTACIGLGAANCVTNNEGIPGNQVLAPNGDLLIAHSGDGGQVFVSRGSVSGTFPNVSAKWHDILLNGSLCRKLPVDSNHVGQSETCGAANFATIAEDSSGHFYVAFSSQRQTVESIGGSPTEVPSGPYETYVVSSSNGETWSKPVQVSTDGSNAFSWITAGSNGRAAVAWYHANETHERPVSQGTIGDALNSQLGVTDPHGYTFDNLHHAEFSVEVGESLNALSNHPHWTVSTVSEHPIKYGPICTQGTVCEVTQGDRSLGDFLEVSHDARGALLFSYVDDTSGYYSVGPSGAVANSGPNVIVRQISGPSLIAGNINGPASGPSLQDNKINSPSGDAFYSANGSRTPASANLDLTRLTMHNSRVAVQIKMQVADLNSLSVSPTIGGPYGEWITRFTTYDPGEPGNGHIYYAGMEIGPNGVPRYFAGEPSRVRYFTLFDSSNTIDGSYEQNSGTITLTLPFSMIGDHGPGTMLYSVTAFTATSAASLSKNSSGLFNQIDATPPIDYMIH
ncbi:MAG: hypothetical protein ACYDCC_13355 [Actinomycetota bacterium]